MLIIAAVLLSIGEGSSKGSSGANADQVLFYGIVPVLVASVLSGLASSLCQWASQVRMKLYFLWFCDVFVFLLLSLTLIMLSFLVTGQETLIVLNDRRDVNCWKFVLVS